MRRYLKRSENWNEVTRLFSPEVRNRHRAQARQDWWTVWESPISMILTALLIYWLIIPLSMLDLFVSVYQRGCFSNDEIPRVVRREYVVIDRHVPNYLNAIEKSTKPAVVGGSIKSFGRKI